MATDKTKKKPYRVDKEKKIIVLNDEVELKGQDKKDVALYLAGGWEIKHKSVKKSQKAKTKAKETEKYDKTFIISELEKLEDKKPLETFNTILKGKGKGKGWFAAKSWYIGEYVNKKEETEEVKEKK